MNYYFGMPDYKRIKEPGSTYFFTVVTYERQPFLCDDHHRTVLRESIEEVRQTMPFTIDAWVLLPDHLHCLWTLPTGDNDYSKRWGMIKRGFTIKMKKRWPKPHSGIPISASRQIRHEDMFWQRRFWEHMIRNQSDFNQHCDYIHFNPVKHGLVDAVRQWPLSTFHRFEKSGIYTENWGGGPSDHIIAMDVE